MPVPAGYSRISLIGHLQPQEVFDTSFWVAGGAASLEDANSLANGVAGIIKQSGTFTNTLKCITNQDGYDTVRAYVYAQGGTAADYVAEATVGLIGTGNPTSLPLQCSRVLTLLTQQVGRSNRGRMFLPATGSLMSSQALISTPLSADLANEWAALFTSVSEIALASGLSPVASVVSFTRSLAHTVSAVRVDNRMDIQRRRANKQEPNLISTVPVA